MGDFLQAGSLKRQAKFTGDRGKNQTRKKKKEDNMNADFQRDIPQGTNTF